MLRKEARGEQGKDAPHRKYGVPRGPTGVSGSAPPSRHSVLSVLISFITPPLRFAASLRRATEGGGGVKLQRLVPKMTFSPIEEEIVPHVPDTLACRP